jgi:hypothetical protein
MYFKKILMLVVLLSLFIFPTSTYAGLITESDVADIANNWLAMNETPMEESMGNVIREIQHYQGGKYGIPGYFVVFLEPNGWIIIPADDQFEPVLAFGRNFLTAQAFEESMLSHFFHIQSPVSSDVYLTSMSSKAHSAVPHTSKSRQQVNRRWQQGVDKKFRYSRKIIQNRIKNFRAPKATLFF